MKTLADVARQMDDKFGSGTAYQITLPFDRMRMHAIHKAVLALAQIPAGEQGWRVLDVGCGEGGVASYWPKQCEFLGVDISEKAIAKARANCPHACYLACPVEKLRDEHPELDPFNIAVAQEAIEHWVDVDSALGGIYCMLRPGGRLVLSTPNRDSLHCRFGRLFGYEPPNCSDDHVHEFHYHELIDRVRSHGFKHAGALGVQLAPVWALEQFVGHHMRKLTDENEEVNRWMIECGEGVPAEYAFIQCHAFVRP